VSVALHFHGSQMWNGLMREFLVIESAPDCIGAMCSSSNIARLESASAQQRPDLRCTASHDSRMNSMHVQLPALAVLPVGHVDATDALRNLTL
jgi:hypothetical protein